MRRGVDWDQRVLRDKHNVLQGLEVRDLAERRGLELSEQCLDRLRIEPFGDGFQTMSPRAPTPASGGLST